MPIDTVTADNRKPVEEMADTEKLNEILVTMRSVQDGLTEMSTKLTSHPLLKSFLK